MIQLVEKYKNSEKPKKKKLAELLQQITDEQSEQAILDLLNQKDQNYRDDLKTYWHHRLFQRTTLMKLDKMDKPARETELETLSADYDLIKRKERLKVTMVNFRTGNIRDEDRYYPRNNSVFFKNGLFRKPSLLIIPKDLNEEERLKILKKPEYLLIPSPKEMLKFVLKTAYSHSKEQGIFYETQPSLVTE